MMAPIIEALRILGCFWLEEVGLGDLDVVADLSKLAEGWPAMDTQALTDLAVEYQRLFGFNLPPYESVFVDPSAMLNAPTTDRVRRLYQQADWSLPANVRAGAPDHLGLEFLALADWLHDEHTDWARRLHTQHLALWVPAFVFALNRLSPHPFYATLADLTLELVLATLPENPIPPNIDPFPDLPTLPVYRPDGTPAPADSTGAEPVSLRDVVKRLTTPRDAGLFLTREDIARVGRALDLPVAVGERSRMLESLFRVAGQYELGPALLDQLTQILDSAANTYRTWAATCPPWNPYANAWRRQIASTRTVLTSV